MFVCLCVGFFIIFIVYEFVSVCECVLGDGGGRGFGIVGGIVGTKESWRFV